MGPSPDTLTRAQRGDPAAQTEILRSCVGPLRILIRRLGAAEDTDDLLQDAMAHVLRVLPRFDPGGTAQLSTWMHAVVYRWLLMQRRKQHLSVVPLEAGLDAPDLRPLPDDLLHRAQLKQHLETALTQLPEAQRRIFVMTQLHHLPLQEVADAEGISLGTVKSRLHRARAELMQLLGDALDEDDMKGGGHASHG